MKAKVKSSSSSKQSQVKQPLASRGSVGRTEAKGCNVLDQCAPTPAMPVRQHYKMAGGS